MHCPPYNVKCFLAFHHFVQFRFICADIYCANSPLYTRTCYDFFLCIQYIVVAFYLFVLTIYKKQHRSTRTPSAAALLIWLRICSALTLLVELVHLLGRQTDLRHRYALRDKAEIVGIRIADADDITHFIPEIVGVETV